MEEKISLSFGKPWNRDQFRQSLKTVNIFCTENCVRLKFIRMSAWVSPTLMLLIYFAIIIFVIIFLGISKCNLHVAAKMNSHEKPTILGQWEVPKTICKSLQTQSSTFPVHQRINFDTNSQRRTTNYITFTPGPAGT